MRKKLLSLLAACFLFASSLPVCAYAQTATVTGSVVNVRSGPGNTYDILGSFSRGDAVEVLDSSDSSWYTVNYNGRTGYMSARYLSLQGTPPASQSATILSPASIGQATIIIPGSDESSAFITPTTPTPLPSQTPSLAAWGSSSTPTTVPAAAATPAPQQTPSLAVAPTQQPTPTAAPHATAQPSSSGSAGQIKGMYVRFRSSPSSDSEIYGEYNSGKALTILGTEGSWTRCEIDGRTGYVFSQYVTAVSAASFQSGAGFITPTQTPTPTAAPLPSPTLATAEAAQATTGTGTGAATAPAAAENNGTIAGDHVRFRSGPATSYSILATYDRGKALSALSAEGGWTRCLIDGQTGYVFSQYVQLGVSGGTGVQTPVSTPLPTSTKEPTLAVGPVPNTPSTPSAPVSVSGTPGYIKGNNVRFRAEPNITCEILADLFYGNAVTITGTTGTWTAVVCNGQAGYVSSQYVATGTFQSVSVGGTASGREIADYALSFVGCSYSWGGKDPSTGFDCSGLVYYVYQHFGYTLNRVAAEQALNGRHVDPADMQAGDILCFYSGGSYIGHVGIYIGNNRFVHAATSSTGVITSELAGYYATRGYEVRRIVND
jgi:cell wall-associated NlpC family hydrolase